MEILNGISVRGRRDWAEYLLVFLNPLNARHKEDAARHQMFLAHVAGIPFPMPAAGAVAPDEVRKKAVREFQCTLRGLVDLWIDSGRGVKGEIPSSRSPHQFGAAKSIEIILLEFWKRNPPSVLFVDEKPSILTQSMARHSDWVHLEELPECLLLQRARDYAIEMFAPLLVSPSRYRIFRCENCHAYFTRERNPKKDRPIIGGTYCPSKQCKSRCRVNRVYDGRKKKLEEMIRYAADAWEEWNPGKRGSPGGLDRARREWIAQKVNARLPMSALSISKTWVKKHQSEIESEMKRRRDVAEKTR